MLDTPHLQGGRALVILDVLQLEHQELELGVHRSGGSLIGWPRTAPLQSLLSQVAVSLLVENVQDLLDRGWILPAELQSNVVQHEDQHFDVALSERVQQEPDDVEEEVAAD